MSARLKEEFGTVSTEKYSEEKYRSIQYYYRLKREQESKAVFSIDDITWNDLNMDEVFFRMNRTSCACGEEYLYDLLRHPVLSDGQLEEREQLIDLFLHEEEERIDLQMAFSPIGKLARISFYEYYHRAKDLPRLSVVQDIIQMILLFLFILLAIPFPGYGGIAVLLTLSVNVISYFKQKKKIENYLQVFSYLVRLTAQVEELSESKKKKNIHPVLVPYFDKLESAAHVFKKFRKHAWLIHSGNSMSGDLMDILMDYVRILFHVDLIQFSYMQKIVRNHGAELDVIFETIGFLDSMIAAASFRASLSSTCIPILTEQKVSLCACDIYHPLLNEPVKNTIDTNTNVLLTGSNASGKSTFLKTIAINAILAQTIHTVAADSYSAGFFRIYSSMALTDNLLGGESYYIVEIKALKRILDAADEAIAAPVLCFIDEVLRGTNTLERIAASTRVLLELAQKHVLIFAATHDLELTELLKEEYVNYHFSETVAESDVRFDYRLKQGCANTRNAIKLLSLFGFSKEITDSAEQMAQQYQRTGFWS